MDYYHNISQSVMKKRKLIKKTTRKIIKNQIHDIELRTLLFEANYSFFLFSTATRENNSKKQYRYDKTE